LHAPTAKNETRQTRVSGEHEPGFARLKN